MEQKTKFKTVDEYLAAFPPNIRSLLEEIRKTIRQVEPEAEEVISYNMPAFRFHGILLYFAAHKEHIGFYPANASLVKLFKNDLESYETSKGTIRFPFDRPLPVDLIRKIVRFRCNENLERKLSKAKKKK